MTTRQLIIYGVSMMRELNKIIPQSDVKLANTVAMSLREGIKGLYLSQSSFAKDLIKVKGTLDRCYNFRCDNEFGYLLSNSDIISALHINLHDSILCYDEAEEIFTKLYEGKTS